MSKEEFSEATKGSVAEDVSVKSPGTRYVANDLKEGKYGSALHYAASLIALAATEENPPIGEYEKIFFETIESVLDHRYRNLDNIANSLAYLQRVSTTIEQDEIDRLKKKLDQTTAPSSDNTPHNS